MSKTINLGHWNLPKMDNKLNSTYTQQMARVAGDLPGAALLLPPSLELKNQPLCCHRADTIWGRRWKLLFHLKVVNLVENKWGIPTALQV